MPRYLIREVVAHTMDKRVADCTSSTVCKATIAQLMEQRALHSLGQEAIGPRTRYTIESLKP